MKMLRRVKSKVLGHGVNGKVKQCVTKAGQKFALKVDKRNENGVFHYFYLVCLPKTNKSSADLWWHNSSGKLVSVFYALSHALCLISKVITSYDDSFQYNVRQKRLPEFGDPPVLGRSQVFTMHGASSVSDKPSDDFLWQRIYLEAIAHFAELWQTLSSSK